jgi:hypothetical protein
MTKPFEHVLGLIPKGVLAGLFVCLAPLEEPHADLRALSVVHGYRRAFVVRRDEQDVVSDPRTADDLT